MEDWKLIWQSKKEISHSIIQQDLQDKEQNYYRTLTLMHLNQPQYYNEVFLQNIIEAILFHHDNSIQFTQMLRQFDSALLRYKCFDFCKALFENKYICQTNKDYIIEIANKSLDNHNFLWFIIELMSLNQLKYHLKPILSQLCWNTQIRNTISLCFHYYFTNDIDYNLSIERSKLNLKLAINAIKRAFKWDHENNQQLAGEIDKYFQKDLVTNEKHVLIAYLLTTEKSTLSIQKPNLTKLLINGLKDQNSNIYLERVLKFMRIHNHKDADNAYRIGVNSLSEIQGELFRVSWQLEKELEKLLSESTQKRNILKLIKNTFSREPFSFSQQFIINLIQLDYQQDHTLIKVFWSLIKKIYNFFFESLYDKNIINIYDFEGVFVDETGKPKLITKVGNMKKNAKKLVPYITQLIINCQPILIVIQKKFIKLFINGDKLYYFFLNFIYEPMSVLHQFSLREDNSQILYSILSQLILKMMKARCIFQKYLRDLKEFLNYHIQNKSQINLKGLGKLTQNLQISDRQQLEIIDKIQSSILGKLRQGERVLSQIDEQLVQNILTSLEGNQSFYFDFPEYSIFIDVLEQEIVLDNIRNIQSASGQLLILCIIRQHQELFDDQFIIQSLNTLVSNLPQILEISGYFREQQQIVQEQQEIERIDQNGDIYYEISNETGPQQDYNIYPTKNQKQLMIYLQLISTLIEVNKEYLLDVELCVNTLRQFLQVYNSEDSYILQFWDISYQIINQLTPYTSDKWLEQEILLTQTQINKFSIATKDFIYCLIINQDNLQYGNIIQYFDIIRQLQGEQKKYIISLLLRKTEQFLEQEFFYKIYFKRNIQYEQIFVTQYLSKYILKQQPSTKQFTFVSQIFLNINDHSIQHQLITMITQNLSLLGIEYFILVFFGMYFLNTKIKSICKQYKGQFQKTIYDLDYNISGYCFLINSILYLTSNCTQCEQLYFIYRKFFKLFLPRKNLNKSKHYMKKQMIITFQFSAFFNEIGNFVPFPHNIDSIFKIIQINESKVPLTLSNSIGVIRSFDQIVELFQFCFNEICNAQRKQQIKDTIKLHQQTTDKCVDSRLFNYQPNSKNIKHNRNLPSISSPTVFYSDNKEIEKILKK